MLRPTAGGRTEALEKEKEDPNSSAFQKHRRYFSHHKGFFDLFNLKSLRATLFSRVTRKIFLH